MKKFFLFTNLFIFCLVMGFSAQAKDVGGIIDKDTVWTKADSPIIVKDNVTVVAGVTLTIEPYVTVKFDKGKALTINGMLVAKGTASEKIIFTSNGAQQAGYWGYIYFSDTSVDATYDESGNYTGGCITQYADIQWGGSAKPVVTINLSSPFIADSLIANNSGNGISITKGSPIISNCEVKNNSGRGIYSGGDGSTTLTVKNTKTLNHSSTGIYAENNSNVSLQNCTVSGNNNSGIYLKGNATISDCTISGNDSFWDSGGIQIDSGTLTIQKSTISGNTAMYSGGGICLNSGTITIQESTISRNISHNDSGAGVAASGTITIQKSIIDGNSVYEDGQGGGISASGTITIEGNTFTNNFAGWQAGAVNAFGSVTIEGNTFTDNSAYYGGGAVAVCGNVTIKNNVFKNNTATYIGGAIWVPSTCIGVTIQGNTIIGNKASDDIVRLDDSMNAVVGGTSCKDGNVIKDNDGNAVHIVNGIVAFNYNDVYNNKGYELINDSFATIDATNCYWGTTDESVIKGGIWGSVTYKPFLTEPCKPDDVTPPSAVTNLSIYSVKSDSVTLNWTAPGDDGDIGTAAQYDIRYSTSEITDANWDDATQCTGEPTPKPAGEPETFTVTDLSPCTTYYFALKAADEVPNWSGLSNVVSCKTTAKTGDVSGDGNITAFDASLILRVVVGILNLNEPKYPYLTLEIADVSGNGTVSALDAALVLQYTVGLITKFPAEEIVPAPSLAGKDENKLLFEAIVMIENVPLSTEQRQVLEQLKRLLYQQKLLPTHTVLLQNYPNPFNPETWIPFKLAEGGKATITIYDVHGRLVRMLSLGHIPPGVYQTKAKAAYWDGRNESGERVASGVYFYRLQSGKFSATRKMVILK